MNPDLYPLWVLAEGAIGLAFGAAWLRAVAEKQRQANAAELYLRGYQALAEEARKNAPAVAAQAELSLVKRQLAAVSDQLFTAVSLMDEWDREELIYLSPEDGDAEADVRVKMRGALAYAGYAVPQAPEREVLWQCDDCGADITRRNRRVCVYCAGKHLSAAAHLITTAAAGKLPSGEPPVANPAAPAQPSQG